MDVLGRVDDEEVFKNFDWSTFFYTRLLNSLKKILQGKKEAYKLNRARSSKAVAYYNIKGYVWAYKTLSTASEHLATKTTVVQPRLKLSPQEKAFKESQIRGDDNMDIKDDESMLDINSSDTNTPTDTMNNQSSDHDDLNNLRSTSSPLLQSNENVGGLNSAVILSPQRKERQTVVD
ncbi:Ulp1-like peptidase [Cucumis melo var. makuwa]|uniref:Ulp1-like peptidase n=1 Tax=Cucumis melo var. makuwa TaxID=1194695 RepID=A0A5A7SYZ5_CUCMM|nr:Ulp1-like peptidase [Cucumis melo var. makuwa]